MNQPAASRFYLETLGCPKNAVDSDKVAASLVADGLRRGRDADEADLVVVNTCAFIEAARQESIDTILALAERPRPGAKLVVTGCMAERYGDELAAALPEVDAVVGLRRRRRDRDSRCRSGMPAAQAVRGPRPARAAARRAERAVGVRQGRRGLRPRVRVLRDPVVPRQAALAHARRRSWPRRARSSTVASPSSCSSPRTSRGTAATPASRARSRRCSAGSTRSRPTASRGSGCSTSTRARCATRSSRRCSSCPTVVPYFDLSLQHADRALLRGMKRWGSGDQFLAMIDGIRAASPTPRSGRRSSSASRARPKPSTTRCSSSSRPPRSTGPASSRSRPKTARRRRRCRARSRRARGRVAARVRGGPGADHARRA